MAAEIAIIMPYMSGKIISKSNGGKPTILPIMLERSKTFSSG